MTMINNLSKEEKEQIIKGLTAHFPAYGKNEFKDYKALEGLRGKDNELECLFGRMFDLVDIMPQNEDYRIGGKFVISSMLRLLAAEKIITRKTFYKFRFKNEP